MIRAVPRDSGEAQGLRMGYEFMKNSMKPKPRHVSLSFFK
jgi:hypothetical protein